MKWVLPAIPAIFAVVSSGAPSVENAEVPTVTYCDLMRNIAEYDDRTVRVTAIVYFGVEESGLYDPGCSGEVNGDGVWVEDLVACRSNSSRAVIRKLDRLLDKDGRAWVTIVGTFRGPKDVEIPEGMNPGHARMMQRVNSRWGHDNAFCCAFEPQTVERVERLSRELRNR